MDAPGQGSETNDETRCVKIAWYSGMLIFQKFNGCFAEASHQRIEVVHVLVDIASDAFLKTCSFIQGFNAFLIVSFAHLSFCPKP